MVTLASSILDKGDLQALISPVLVPSREQAPDERRPDARGERGTMTPGRYSFLDVSALGLVPDSAEVIALQALRASRR
jgi:hypothetical protein